MCANARKRARRAQDPDYREKERARCRAYYIAHKQEIVERIRAYEAANKDKVKKWARRYREAHKQEIKEHARAYREAHREEMAERSRAVMRRYELRRKYGLSAAEYDALLAKQNGACAICRRRPKGKERLYVDHCHITGLVRGLLCQACNFALGWFRDDQTSLIAALVYLCARQRDGPGSAAQRALLVRAALPRAPVRKAMLKELHFPAGRFHAALCT
jgi:Autographiviridae endonuclease VII